MLLLNVVEDDNNILALKFMRDILNIGYDDAVNIASSALRHKVLLMFMQLFWLRKKYFFRLNYLLAN